MNFVGRDYELDQLNTLYKAEGSQLVAVYGRRRVGKSTLVEQLMLHKPNLQFEGLEKVRTKGQIEQFTIDLRHQVADSILDSVVFANWQAVFEYLTRYFDECQEKQLIFFDEFQWMAVGQSKLVSLIKSYWDRYWSKQNIMLVLCGSVSSYMIKRVIKSKAMYGRINYELALQPFSPPEIKLLLNNKRSNDEVLLYSLIFGGIPKYLREIDVSKSFDQNMSQLLFVRNGQLVGEYEKIFYSQFKEPKIYEAIAKVLSTQPMSQEDIAKKIKLSSGGGWCSYFTNL